MRTRAILFTGVGEVALGETEVPEPGPGEVLVEAAFSCVSPGTELRCLAGSREAGVDFPFIPGYAMAGTVVARGAGAALEVGARVFCGGTARAAHSLVWGGHVGHAVLPAESAYPLPAGVDMLDASACVLAAVGYHGARVGGTRPGDQVAVVGLGPIGQLAARSQALMGGRVVALDRSAARVELARRAGLEAAVVAGSLAEALAPLMPGGADVVVDATGTPAVLPDAIGLARELPWGDDDTPGARYIVQGSYPAGFTVPYQPAFRRELSFIVPRSVQPRDTRAVLEHMAAGRLRLRDIVSDVRPPERAPETYAELQWSPGELLTVAFRWQ